MAPSHISSPPNLRFQSTTTAQHLVQICCRLVRKAQAQPEKIGYLYSTYVFPYVLPLLHALLDLAVLDIR
jgi:hypothetical protein